MKVLLDTCAFVWLCSNPDRFSSEARSVFNDNDPLDLYLSDASVFEIALKCSQGKMELPEPPREWIAHQLETWRIQSLEISHEVLFSSAELPWHHKDPFDRLIIATAKNFGLPVMTSDRSFPLYDIKVVW